MDINPFDIGRPSRQLQSMNSNNIMSEKGPSSFT